MTGPAVFVTGATGLVGGSVVSALLAAGVPVIAATRSPEDATHLPRGTVSRQFDFGSAPAVLEEALDGVDRLFLMRPPPIADVARYLFPLVEAAQRRGVRHIVFLSLQGVQTNRKTPHHAVESYLRSTAAPYIFLRPNFFMQNLSTTYAARIRERGEIFVPAGRSRTAFIDARDIGRVAAAVFAEPEHVRRAHTLSGPQSLSYSNVAKIMSQVLGRTIRYLQPTETEYLARLRSDGSPEDYIAVQRMIYRVVRFNLSALPNHSIQRLTGAPATTFRTFVEDNADEWAAER